MFRLSPQQKHIWHLRQGEHDRAWITQGTITLSGGIDPRKVESALGDVIAQNEILRTGFPLPQGMILPLQAIADPAPFALTFHDWRGLSQADQTRQLAALAQDHAAPFDLAHPPLLRATLIQTQITNYSLLITLSSFIADARTLDLLADQLAARLSGAPAEDAIQYADLAEWLNETLENADNAAEAEAWYTKIIAAPIVVRLPFERIPDDMGRFDPQAVTRTLDAAAAQKLDAHAAPEPLHLAAFLALIQRLSGQDEFVIGLGCHGRTYEELETAPGPFSRFLPFPAAVTSDTTFNGLLQNLPDALADAYDHQEYFSWDVAANAGGDSPLPFFALNYAYQPGADPVSQGGVTLQVGNSLARGDRFNLNLTVTERDGLPQFDFHYDALLFDAAAIERLADHFINLLTGLAASPNAAIGALDITTPAERTQLLETFNATDISPAPQTTLAAMITAQAAKTPDAPAVIFQERALSYRELHARAAALARRLQMLGVGPGTFVGLFTENSHEMLIGMLGIIQAGGAYLPLDPDYPAERIAFMLQDAGATLVLTQSKLQSTITTYQFPNVKLLFLDQLGDESATGSAAPLGSGPAPEDHVYVIYTSGSTGKPKGVPIMHRNLVHSIHARHHYYGTPVGRYLLLSSFSFDSSVAGIFWALTTGGALVLPEAGMARDPRAIADLIRTQAVTHTLALPSLYNLILEEGALASLQVVIVAGEACPPALIGKHFAALPGAALYNEYGPTEGTVWATVYQIPPPLAGGAGGGGAVPIGKPIPGAQVYLLNGHQQPAPLGVAGELYIGGPGVARGYLNRAEETERRFVLNPFIPDEKEKRREGEKEKPLFPSSPPPLHPSSPLPLFPSSPLRLYKTGDLARWLPDGNIEFLGRVDNQVKIRGYRVELGEIEAAILQHPGVREAAVIAREDTPGDQRLVAYFSSAEQKDELTARLKDELTASLPAYMVPAIFVALDKLPLTPNGKIDRNRLPAPDRARRASTSEFLAPRTPVEEVLTGIWADVLDLETVGINDNFFELGGHSILVTQLVSRVRDALPVDLPLRTIFDHPSVASLAATLLALPNRPEIERTAELTMQVARLSEDELDKLLDG